MNNMDILLKHIQKTNPNMTKDRLILELNNNTPSAVALVMVWKNSEKS